MILNRATASDFEFVYNCYMADHSNPYLLYEVQSKEDFMPIFEELIQQKIVNILFDEDSTSKVGMCKLLPLKHRNSHILYVGGIAISQTHLGKGYAKKLFNEIILHAKNNNFKRLELSVATFNQKAIKLYQSFGFEIEGKMRNYTYLKSENRFIDEYIMSLLLS